MATFFSTADADRNFPFVEINLDNLVHNLRQIRAITPPSVGVMAVVKDNAYGCGSVMISRVLEQNGVRFFAVAQTCEARLLRESDITSPILVLGRASAADIRWGASAGIRFSLNDIGDLQVWKSLAAPIRFHVNFDTGMGRLGLLPEEAETLAAECAGRPDLIVEGAYTHFAKADDPDAGPTDLQLVRFRKAMDALAAGGLRPAIIHFANSAGIMRQPLPDCTVARPGIVLYGCKPDAARDFPLALKPVLRLAARVVKTKRVAAGTPVSYGGTYVTASDTTIATIGLGYGQGLPRRLGNKGSILIRGRRFKIAGRVTMDYIMVDVGADAADARAVAVGDEAVAVGGQGGECILPDEIALQCDTIAYEILCSISSRIDRYYILNGKVIRHEPCRPF